MNEKKRICEKNFFVVGIVILFEGCCTRPVGCGCGCYDCFCKNDKVLKKENL